MPFADREERPPVGVLPYRLPPLSGLYRLHYRPPAAARSGDDADANVLTAKQTGALKQQSLLDSERHRRLHAQVLQSSSLDDGTVDLFLLYSVCSAVPVPCLQCTLHMDTTMQTCSYRLRETYAISADAQERGEGHGGNTEDKKRASAASASSLPVSSSLLTQLQDGWYAFFFPMSECGRLKDNLLVCVNDALVAGDVAECNFSDGGVLRPLLKTTPSEADSLTSWSLTSHTPFKSSAFGQRKTEQAAGTASASSTNANGSTASGQHRPKPLFYYIVSPVLVHRGSASAEMTITVSWRSYPAAQPGKRKEKMFTLLYSYYCAPRAPDAVTCRAQFHADARLRLVRSPNCEGAMQLKSEVTQHAARVRVETVDGSSLEMHRHPKDYTLQICFYFGEYTGLLEETSWFAALVVAAVFLIVLWFFLTKDLVV